MSSTLLVSVAAFLLAFKAVLVEGSEVAVLSLATVKQIGKRNVLLGVIAGGLASTVTFLLVRQLFLLFPDYLIDLGTGAIILYFSYRFLRGFVKYYFKGKSFRTKMEMLTQKVVQMDLGHSKTSSGIAVFSFANSLPIITITLTEGFEASLVIAAAGIQNLEYATFGALASIAILSLVSAISYDYLMRVPRWLLDLVAGVILLIFGLYFATNGVLLLRAVI